MRSAKLFCQTTSGALGKICFIEHYNEIGTLTNEIIFSGGRVTMKKDLETISR